MASTLIVLVVLLARGAPASSALQDPAKIVVTTNGATATGVPVILVLNGEKLAQKAPDLKGVAAKFAKGTRIDVYRLGCLDGKLEVMLVPAGEQLGPEDKDCLKTKEPPPGATCRCGWIGAFSLGEGATIDVEAGTVKANTD